MLLQVRDTVTNNGTIADGFVIVPSESFSLAGAGCQCGVNLLGSDLVDVNGVLNFGSATLAIDVHVGSGPVPTEITLFEYDGLPVVPSSSQIVLSGDFTLSGISTTGNRLTLTGVTASGLLFSDDLESGDLSRWSGSLP